jgi:hypothetical protein
MARIATNRQLKVVGTMAALLVFAGLVAAPSARAQTPGTEHVLFKQQDAVQAFDFNTGTGFQIGTATGSIAGTTYVSFQFVPSGPPVGDALPFTFVNKVIVTDIDGDQLFFDNNGTGTFHLGGSDFRGTGGPLTGTYVVTGGTGKYQSWTVGTTFTYHAVATNPPSPAGGFGNVYVEVSYHDRGNH